MVTAHSGKRLERAVILTDTLRILEDITAEWETGFSGPLGPDTRLAADLAFQSLDVVHLTIDLEEHFGRRFPFEELLVKPDGRYVEDVRVSELVEFLFVHDDGLPPA